LRRIGIRRDRLIEFVEPAADLIPGMHWQTGEFESGDVAAILHAQNNRIPLNPGGRIQCKGKRNLFGQADRQHGAE
jgi:hypothetical protein